MSRDRRAIYVNCDGLARDWVTRATTPTLHDLAGKSLWCREHRAVFPSVTRVSAASVATGCHARRHGLHGNRMGLIEQSRIVVRDVGLPDFRQHLRKATGRTLHVPALAERVAGAGGFVGFSNVSPGAAYFLDPEHFGHIYHRAGSYGPGGAPIGGADALNVSHDLAGDRVMTERFCGDVLLERSPVVSILWLANPDLTLHGAPIGSPAHHEALRQADRNVGRVHRSVEQLRSRGIDVLLLIGSDHGQETIGDCVDLESWFSAQGLSAMLAAGDIAVAGQGTAALLYATPQARPALLDVLEVMRREPWVADIVTDDFAQLGHAASGGVVAAVNTARREEANAYGVIGKRWVIAEPGKPAAIGCGQHGGWGPDETSPFLMLDHPEVGHRSCTRPTSLVDIAPTILAFLGLPSDGCDGTPLVDFASKAMRAADDSEPSRAPSKS
ncbi:MAG TPA: alkaline phosphatase family protein [Xanthobacteraceae bacterium]|nr:alkaline phosphatase family protein [Xanthobacteraceae bacterium]